MLFPLPLTAFENYMLVDDRPEYPMSFFLRLKFWGRLDRSAFASALRQTVARHPLFRAFVRPVDGRACWVRAEGTTPRLQWDESDESTAEQAGYLDLSNEVGLRVCVTHCDGQARVLFQFHHCCCDGVGAVQFIEDLLTTYTSEYTDADSRPVLTVLDPTLLRRRGSHGLGFWKRLLRAPVELLAAYGIQQFFCNRPKALETSSGSPATSRSTDAPASISRRFSPAELDALRRTARQEGVTINDLLIRDLLLAIENWNSKFNPSACGQYLRVSVPVNLRLPQDEKMPSTNAVSIVFMDRKVRPRSTPRKLLTSIRIDTLFIKKLRLAVVFTWVLEVLHAIRGGYQWLLGGEDCLSTAVLSNLGVRFHDLPLGYLGDRVIVGDAMLDTIDFLPPIRRGTNAAIGVVTYAGEMMLTLQYCPSALNRDLAGEMLNLFAEQIARTSGVTVPSSETVNGTNDLELIQTG